MNDTSRPDPPELGWGHLPDGAPGPTTPGGEPSAAPDGQPPSAGNGWTTVRVVLFWLVLALGVVGLVGGVGLVLDDMSDTTDSWHGFGIFIGTIVAIPGACMASLAGFGLRAQRRRGPDSGRVYAFVLGSLLLVSLVLVPATPAALVPATLGGLLVASAYGDRKQGRTATR